jgi:hypothetical protein
MDIKKSQPILLYACFFGMFFVISADSVSENTSPARFYLALLILVAGGALFKKCLFHALPMKLQAILHGLFESISNLVLVAFGAITYHSYLVEGKVAVYMDAVIYFIIACFSFKKGFDRFIRKEETVVGHAGPSLFSKGKIG